MEWYLLVCILYRCWRRWRRWHRRGGDEGDRPLALRAVGGALEHRPPDPLDRCRIGPRLRPQLAHQRPGPLGQPPEQLFELAPPLVGGGGRGDHAGGRRTGVRRSCVDLRRQAARRSRRGAGPCRILRRRRRCAPWRSRGTAPGRRRRGCHRARALGCSSQRSQPPGGSRLRGAASHS